MFFRKQDKNNISNQVQNYNNDKSNITAEKYEKMVTKNKQFK
jgi:hypothetical protein